MSAEPCSEHGVMCGKIGSMEAKIDALKASVDEALVSIKTHITEADRPGGVRDRVTELERTISVIKQGYWKACIVSAVVGGLLARLAPEIIWSIVIKIMRSATQ